MRHGRTLRSLALALAATLSPATTGAAEAERLPAKPFDVTVAGGVVTVHFTLAMSDAASCPVTASDSYDVSLMWQGRM